MPETAIATFPDTAAGYDARCAAELAEHVDPMLAVMAHSDWRTALESDLDPAAIRQYRAEPTCQTRTAYTAAWYSLRILLDALNARGLEDDSETEAFGEMVAELKRLTRGMERQGLTPECTADGCWCFRDFEFRKPRPTPQGYIGR